MTSPVLVFEYGSVPGLNRGAVGKKIPDPMPAGWRKNFPAENRRPTPHFYQIDGKCDGFMEMEGLFGAGVPHDPQPTSGWPPKSHPAWAQKKNRPIPSTEHPGCSMHGRSHTPSNWSNLGVSPSKWGVSPSISGKFLPPKKISRPKIDDPTPGMGSAIFFLLAPCVPRQIFHGSKMSSLVLLRTLGNFAERYLRDPLS